MTDNTPKIWGKVSTLWFYEFLPSYSIKATSFIRPAFGGNAPFYLEAFAEEESK